jgi:hypothetical protein
MLFYFEVNNNVFLFLFIILPLVVLGFLGVTIWIIRSVFRKPKNDKKITIR